MNIIKKSLPFLCLITLANCSSGGGGGGSTDEPSYAENPARARFVDVGSNGLADIDLTDERNRTVSNAVGTVAYVAGIDTERAQVVTAVGYVETGGVGEAVTSGTIDYDVSYGGVAAYNIYRPASSSQGGAIGADLELVRGDVILTADFDQGVLTGGDDVIDVNGVISGTDLGGSVGLTHPSYPTFGVDADLEGAIGADGVIGAFKGVSDDDVTVSGGFVGTSN